MGWGEPIPPPMVPLATYDALWHRYQALLRILRVHVRDQEDNPLPSPHELRTGQTPDDVRRGFDVV